MSYTTKIILAVFFTLGLGGALYWYETSYRNHYSPGDAEVFNLEVEETFAIKIHSNSSTGCQNCWINKEECLSVKKVSESYVQSWLLKDYEGSGSTATWTFEAVKPGTDTIKIAICPTIIMDVDCSHFKEDSVTADYTFIVKVKPQ